MNETHFFLFALGWFGGAAVVWWHFHSSGLIRSRSEWYADRKRRGLWVPEDWREDEPT